MSSGQYHACGFLFHRASQRVLLHHRDARASALPNCWSFFCGGPEAVDHDDPAATWCREVQEEIGVTLQVGQMALLRTSVDPRYGKLRHVFVAEWPDLSTTFTLSEGDGVGWFTLEEALALPDLSDIAKDELRQVGQEPGACPLSPPRR